MRVSRAQARICEGVIPSIANLSITSDWSEPMVAEIVQTPRKPRKTRRKFTYADYASAPPGKRYELLDGELTMVPAPGIPHQDSVFDLGVVLKLLIRSARMGRVFIAPVDVVLSDTDVVQPDLVFVSNARARIITDANIQGAPDLVIEILSPSTERTDRVFKRALYARHGVREYWLVDTRRKTIEQLLLDGDDFKLAGVFSAGETLTSPTLGGYALEVSAAFVG